MFKHVPPIDTDKNFVPGLMKCNVIAIHGPSGSGKTHLAKELFARIGGTHVEIDKIPSEPNPSKSFMDQVNFPEIEKRIRNGIPPVFVDCYIVLDILNILKIKADMLLQCDRSGDISGIAPDLDSDFESYKKRHNTKPHRVFTLEKSN